jgi:hypothetical protein
VAPVLKAAGKVVATRSFRYRARHSADYIGNDRAKSPQAVPGNRGGEQIMLFIFFMAASASDFNIDNPD